MGKEVVKKGSWSKRLSKEMKKPLGGRKPVPSRSGRGLRIDWDDAF